MANISTPPEQTGELFLSPYKSYIALLMQTNENPIAASVMENTVGAMTSIYGSEGSYYLVGEEGMFPQDKTFVNIINNRGFDTNIYAYATGYNGTSDAIGIEVADNTGVGKNTSLMNTPIEIRVYQ